jgi:hypothetical protein
MAETTYAPLQTTATHTRLMYDLVNSSDYFNDVVIDQYEELLWNVALAGLQYALKCNATPFHPFYHGRDTECGRAFLNEARRVVFLVRETLRLNC